MKRRKLTPPRNQEGAYRFIAFSMVTGNRLGCGRTAQDAIDHALRLNLLDGSDFIEVLDCREGGWKIWSDGGVFPPAPIYLSVARRNNVTVFRGNGYATSFAALPAMSLPT